jgi:hypothetical protein
MNLRPSDTREIADDYLKQASSYKGIVSPRMKGMTFGDSDQCQKNSLQNSVSNDSLAGIARACGVKPAGRRPEG